MADSSLDSIPDDILAQAMVEVSFKSSDALQYLPYSLKLASPEIGDNSSKTNKSNQLFCSWMNTHGISFDESTILYQDNVDRNATLVPDVPRVSDKNRSWNSNCQNADRNMGCFPNPNLCTSEILPTEVPSNNDESYYFDAKQSLKDQNISTINDPPSSLSSTTCKHDNLMLHPIPGTDCYLVYPDKHLEKDSANDARNQSADLILQGKFFYSPHYLPPKQVMRILPVLQRRKNDLCSPYVGNDSTVVYDKNENTRIHYQVVSPTITTVTNSSNLLPQKKLKLAESDKFACTRSGRVSKPPKHLLKDYDQTYEPENAMFLPDEMDTMVSLHTKCDELEDNLNLNSVKFHEAQSNFSRSRNKLIQLRLLGPSMTDIPFEIDEFLYENSFQARKRGRAVYKSDEERQRAQLLSKTSSVLQSLTKCSMKETLQVIVPMLSQSVSLKDYFLLTLLEKSPESLNIKSLLEELNSFVELILSFLKGLELSDLLPELKDDNFKRTIEQQNRRFSQVKNSLDKTFMKLNTYKNVKPKSPSDVFTAERTAGCELNDNNYVSQESAHNCQNEIYEAVTNQPEIDLRKQNIFESKTEVASNCTDNSPIDLDKLTSFHKLKTHLSLIETNNQSSMFSPNSISNKSQTDQCHHNK